MQTLNHDMLIIRGATGSLIVLETLAAVPLCLCIVAALKKANAVAPLIIVLTGMCLIALWVKGYVVRVFQGRLERQTFLGGRREINLVDIEEATVEAGRQKYMDRFRPPLRLAIKPHNHASAKSFDINLRLFSRNDIARLLNVLSELNNVPVKGIGKPARDI